MQVFQTDAQQSARHVQTFEQPVLRPLTLHPYQYVEIKRAKVNIDYHVHYEPHYYSVPHQYVGLSLEVHARENLVQILYQGNEITIHRRINRYGFSTEPSHMLLSVLHASKPEFPTLELI